MKRHRSLSIKLGFQVIFEGGVMSAIQAMQNLLESEKQRQEADLRDLNIIRGLLSSLDKKLDEKFAELNPESQYRLLSIHNVMDLIGLGDKWITDRVADKSFPAPKLIGGKRKWYQKDIERWIQENMEKTEH